MLLVHVCVVVLRDQKTCFFFSYYYSIHLTTPLGTDQDETTAMVSEPPNNHTLNNDTRTFVTGFEIRKRKSKHPKNVYTHIPTHSSVFVFGMAAHKEEGDNKAENFPVHT